MLLKNRLSLEELISCLHEYFDGSLDNFPDYYLSRLYLPPEKLIPGNSLAGLLDQATMKECLWSLEQLEYFAICYYFEPEQSHNGEELLSIYVGSESALNFDSWVLESFKNSIINLSEAIDKRINIC